VTGIDRHPEMIYPPPEADDPTTGDHIFAPVRGSPSAIE